MANPASIARAKALAVFSQIFRFRSWKPRWVIGVRVIQSVTGACLGTSDLENGIDFHCRVEGQGCHSDSSARMHARFSQDIDKQV